MSGFRELFLTFGHGAENPNQLQDVQLLPVCFFAVALFFLTHTYTVLRRSGFTLYTQTLRVSTFPGSVCALVCCLLPQAFKLILLFNADICTGKKRRSRTGTTCRHPLHSAERAGAHTRTESDMMDYFSCNRNSGLRLCAKSARTVFRQRQKRTVRMGQDRPTFPPVFRRQNPGIPQSLLLKHTCTCAISVPRPHHTIQAEW